MHRIEKKQSKAIGKKEHVAKLKATNAEAHDYT